MVLNNSAPLILEFIISDIINGIITAKTVTEIAYTKVFIKICLKTGSVKTAL